MKHIFAFALVLSLASLWSSAEAEPAHEFGIGVRASANWFDVSIDNGSLTRHGPGAGGDILLAYRPQWLSGFLNLEISVALPTSQNFSLPTMSAGNETIGTSGSETMNMMLVAFQFCPIRHSIFGLHLGPGFDHVNIAGKYTANIMGPGGMPLGTQAGSFSFDSVVPVGDIGGSVRVNDSMSVIVDYFKVLEGVGGTLPAPVSVPGTIYSDWLSIGTEFHF